MPTLTSPRNNPVAPPLTQQPLPPSTVCRRSVDVNPTKRRRTDTPSSSPTNRRHDAMILKLHQQRLARDAQSSTSSPSSSSSTTSSPPTSTIHTTIIRRPRQYPRPVRRIRSPQVTVGGFSSLTALLLRQQQDTTSSDESTTSTVPASPRVPTYTGPIISIFRPRHVARTPNTRRHVHFTNDVQSGVELDLSSHDTSFSITSPSPPPSPIDLDEPEHGEGVAVLDPPTNNTRVELYLSHDTSFLTPSPSPPSSPLDGDDLDRGAVVVLDPLTNNNPVVFPPTPGGELPHIQPLPPLVDKPHQPLALLNIAPPLLQPTANLQHCKWSRFLVHVDIAILTKAKLTDNIYPRSYMGYTITATTAPSINQGGIALAWRDTNGYSVESVNIHGPTLLVFNWYPVDIDG
jgi:hypothetical protein